jgi:2-polyprenyl-3-methyl-5-hydroxy-6-metoxy-1,4-benzoquinol methylase
MASNLIKRVGDRDPMVGLLGWRAVLLYGDPCAFDRWLWVRRRAESGDVATLDAGTGNGAFAMYAASRGNDVVAVSDFPASLEKGERRARSMGLDRVRFRLIDLRELDRFADELGSYDQSFCLEVIEHIVDDRKLLRDLASVIRPGGRLLITTPYLHHIPYHDELVTDAEDGGHVRTGYTHEELGRLLTEAGFRVTEQTSLSGIVSQTLNNLMQRGNRIHPHLGWALTLPLRLLRPLDGPLTRLSRRPYLSIALEAVRE